LIAIYNIQVVDDIHHIQTLNNYMKHFKGWLKRFHGIGTDFIENHLSWFRFMEGNTEYSNKKWVKKLYEESFRYLHSTHM
jgi:hypothetical protein